MLGRAGTASKMERTHLIPDLEDESELPGAQD